MRLYFFFLSPMLFNSVLWPFDDLSVTGETKWHTHCLTWYLWLLLPKKIYSIPYKQFGLVLQYYYNTCILIEYLLFMPLTTRYIMNQIHDNISSVWNNKSFLFSFKVFMQVIRFMFIPYFCFYFWCSVTFMI